MRARRSGGSLPLIELLLAILFFSLAAAIALRVFAAASVTNARSDELSRAALAAQNAAEAFKGCGGDMDETARLTGGELEADGSRLSLYVPEGEFTLTLSLREGDGLAYADISVYNEASDAVFELKAATERETEAAP